MGTLRFPRVQNPRPQARTTKPRDSSRGAANDVPSLTESTRQSGLAVTLLFACLAALAVACGLVGGGGGKKNGGTPGSSTEGVPTQPGAEAPEDALARWVQNRLNVGFVANCDDAKRPDDIGKQCARSRGERNGMQAFELGPTFSDATRLMILAPVGDSWTIAHLETRDPNAPVPGIPWPLEVGVSVVVAGTGDCLKIRERPGMLAPEVACLDDGTTVTVAEGSVSIDDREWWRLEGYGWAASDWLRYPEEAPTPTPE